MLETNIVIILAALIIASAILITARMNLKSVKGMSEDTRINFIDVQTDEEKLEEQREEEVTEINRTLYEITGYLHSNLQYLKLLGFSANSRRIEPQYEMVDTDGMILSIELNDSSVSIYSTSMDTEVPTLLSTIYGKPGEEVLIMRVRNNPNYCLTVSFDASGSPVFTKKTLNDVNSHHMYGYSLTDLLDFIKKNQDGKTVLETVDGGDVVKFENIGLTIDIKSEENSFSLMFKKDGDVAYEVDYYAIKTITLENGVILQKPENPLYGMFISAN